MIEDYGEYVFLTKEKVTYILIGFIISSIVAVLFYNSFIAVIVFSPYCLVYLRGRRWGLIKKRKWTLNLEFRDCMLSLMAALNAGYSIENAFSEALEDMKKLYQGESYIVPELDYIVKQLRINRNIEELLIDFANRSGIDDIYNFAEVFSVTKRTGGDVIKIMKLCCNNIGDKIDVKREILTMISAKQFESKIMNVVPFGIIMYLWLFSPGFLNPVYHNLIGIVFMTVMLLLYFVALKLSEKITDIEV